MFTVEFGGFQILEIDSNLKGGARRIKYERKIISLRFLQGC